MLSVAEAREWQARVAHAHETFKSVQRVRFSVFDAFQPNENAVSRVLKYLLDPASQHGQGDRFLRQFLSIVRVPTYAAVRVDAEHTTTDGRRIDLLIELRDCVIGLENKVYAIEQRMQCADYCRYLEHRASGKEWRLVFLTPDGKTPLTAGDYDRSEHVVCLSYTKLLSTFQTDDVFIAEFLRQFRRYINEQVLGRHEMDIVGEEFVKPENVEVTLSVLNRRDAILQYFQQRVAEGIRERLVQEFGGEWRGGAFENMRPVETLSNRYSGLFFFKAPWDGRYAVGFESEPALIFGVRYFAQHPNDHLPEPYASLEREIGGGKRTEYWAWYRHVGKMPGLSDLYNEPWTSERVLCRMALDSGKGMIDDLLPLLKRIIEVAGRYIDDNCQAHAAGAL